jgi:hypothetical protein
MVLATFVELIYRSDRQVLASLQAARQDVQQGDFLDSYSTYHAWVW